MKIILLLLISSACYSQVKPKDTANYYNIAKLEMWQLIWKAVNDPDNVTRKQVSDISHWLIQVRKVIPDTSKPKK